MVHKTLQKKVEDLQSQIEAVKRQRDQAQVEAALAKAFYDVAVKERDYECQIALRLKEEVQQLQHERDKALAAACSAEQGRGHYGETLAVEAVAGEVEK